MKQERPQKPVFYVMVRTFLRNNKFNCYWQYKPASASMTCNSLAGRSYLLRIIGMLMQFAEATAANGT